MIHSRYLAVAFGSLIATATWVQSKCLAVAFGSLVATATLISLVTSATLEVRLIRQLSHYPELTSIFTRPVIVLQYS